MKTKNKKQLDFLALGFLSFILFSTIIPTHEKANAATNFASGASYYADNANDKYYEGISDDLVGEDLIKALSTLTSTGFQSHDYGELPSIYQYSDLSLSGNGKMRLAYTGTEVNFSSGSMPSGTNKEHVWPASWYGNGKRTQSAGSPGADAHNVWPAETGLNSKRGSCAFDELDFSSSYKCLEYGKYDYALNTDNDSYVWSTAFNNSNGQPTDAMYPAKGHRGEIARILMYVATRYRNNTSYPVMLHDQAVTLKTGRIGKLSTLLKWHYLEPPTEWEIKRNNEVASRWHHNRNPFVDHPEYAGRIYYYLNEPDKNAPSNKVKEMIDAYGDLKQIEVESIQIQPRDVHMVVGSSKTLSIQALPTGASKQVEWKSLDTNIAAISSSGVIQALKKGTVRIVATSKKNSMITDEIIVSIKEATSIQVEGEPIKKEYYAGETFNPEGLKVLVSYSDGTTEYVNVNDCEWLDGNTHQKVLSLSTETVICKYGSLMQTISGITVIQNDSTDYELVKDSSQLTDGQYLIVSQDSSVALDGSLDNIDVASNIVSVQIEDNKIESSEKIDKASFTFIKDNGTFKGTNDLFIGHSGSSNGIYNSEEYSHTITISSSGDATISISSYSLRFNSASGQNRFRYYKSGQQPVQLFKKASSIPTPIGANLTSLSLEGSLNKTAYCEHEPFNPEGLTIYANYTDNSKKDVTQFVSWETLKAGMTSVTGTYAEKGIEKTITISNISVTQNSSYISVSSISLNHSSYELKEGEELVLEVSILPLNATTQEVFFESSDRQIATVNAMGKIVAKKEGTAIITVTSLDNESAQATCEITITKRESIGKNCAKSSTNTVLIFSLITFVSAFVLRKKHN